MQATWVEAGLALAILLSCGVDRGSATNDDFANAASVSGLSVQVVGSNINFTAEAEEPQHCGLDAERSAWWVLSNDVSGFVTIHTLGSDFDTRMAVYSGTSLPSLALVGENDDYETSLQSLVQFYADAGTAYWIAVDGVGAQGSIRLSVVDDDARPANAVFTNRTTLSGLSAEWSGSNSNSIADGSEPLIGGMVPASPLWWSWTAPTSCVMEADTRGSVLDTVLGVYTGSVLGALTEVASTNDCGTNIAARVWWEAQAGVTYQIAVDGVYGEWGGIQLKLGEVEAPVIAGVLIGEVRWNSLAGEDYRVLRSTNLFDWASVTSLVAEAGETVVNLAGETAPRAFYRISRYLP